MSNINLGQDLGLGELPTDEEAALIRHNIKIDVDLGQDPTEGAGVAAPINTVGFYDDGSNPRALQHFKKTGDGDLEWSKLIFKTEIDTLLSTTSSVIELGVPDPSSGVGVVADIGTYGYEEGDKATSTWWFKFGTNDTDWKRIALFSDLAQFIEDFRTEGNAPAPVSGAVTIDAEAYTVQNLTLTEDTSISFAGFTTGTTSVIVNIILGGFELSFADANVVQWSDDEFVLNSNRAVVRIFVENYGTDINITFIGEQLL